MALQTIFITLGSIVLALIVFRLTIRFLLKGEGLYEQAQGALSKIGDCCKWFFKRN